jgi:ATP-binding cassette subfamily F protein 3
LSLEVHDSDRICVIGPNGRGKSTLLRLLAGALEPRAGGIVQHPRLAMGYFAQTNVAALDERRTVLEEILSASSTCLPQTARDIAGGMMFEGDHALKKIAVLSGGERSRVTLGKLIATPCNLLLLDEPTNHLDMDSCDSLLAAIDAFEGAAVIVTHNEMFLHSLATHFIVFDRGRVRVFNGSYQDFLETVGWENDEKLGASVKIAPAPTKTAVAQPAASAAPERKPSRQARAKLVQERSRVLGPLEKRVADLETHIEKLEREREETFRLLSEASAAGHARDIAELSKKSREIGPRIDVLYGQLDTATRDLERETKAFDERDKSAG